jgi:hypothetical protein
MEQSKKLVLKALPFTIIDGKLYKQRQDQILGQCLHGDKILVLIREMHEGVGGKHDSSKNVGCQILVANSAQGCTITLSIL